MPTFWPERFSLTLKDRATFLNTAVHGLSFLGMRIFRGYLRVRSENRRRSLKHLHAAIAAYKRGDLDDDRMQQSLTSISGHLRYFCPTLRISVSQAAT